MIIFNLLELILFTLVNVLFLISQYWNIVDSISFVVEGIKDVYLLYKYRTIQKGLYNFKNM